MEDGRRRIHRGACVFAFVFLAVVAVTGASEVPLGHPDFYPSPERPIGWRGDGTGAWPGASPVTNWNPDTGANVVWRSPMPAPSFAQPLVVGEKVFTMADPDILVCVNAHDGKILWQTEIDHTTVMKPEMREKARAEKKFIAELRRDFGKWRAAQSAFERKLQDRKISVEAVKVAVDMAASEKGGDDSLGLVAGGDTIDDALKAEYVALTKEKQEKPWNESRGYQCGIELRPGTPIAERLVKANRDFDLYVSDNWGEPWCSGTFATPCSDGRSLYVTTQNNAVARVGLDGTIRWLVWDHVPDRDKGSNGWFGGTGIGTRFVPSPVYYQGKLVVNQNGEIRVYDAETGRRIWGTFNPYKITGQFPWRPAPEACNLTCTTLSLPDGSKLPLVTDGQAFFRLEDGGMLAGRFQPVGGAGSMIVGDTLLWKIHRPPLTALCGAHRFRLVSRDEMATENIWKENTGGSGYSNAYRDGRLYSFNVVFDTATGKSSVLDPTLGTAKGGAGIGHCSPIIAGSHLYTVSDCGGGGDAAKAWIFPVAGGRVITLDPAYRDGRVLKEQEWIWRWGWVGNMNHSSPSAQANRLFFRTKGYLWCFGDPKTPFPAPRDCPVEARVGG